MFGIDNLAVATGAFSELSLIVGIAAAVAVIMHKLKQPLIVGYIVSGLIAGPLVFDIVHSEDTVEIFSRIGIALLLFIIGLGLNPKVIKEIGRVSVIAASVQVFTSFTLGFLVGRLFSFTNQISLIIGVAIAFSSTIIILKLISDKREQNRLYGRLTIGLLLIQDIFATIALLLLSTSSGDGFTIGDGLGLLWKGSLLGGGLFVFSTKVLPLYRQTISESQELLFLLSLGWGLGLPAIFELAGFSFEVGALVAGVTIASQNYAQEISAKLRPLRDFFIVLFFVQLGTELSFDGIIQHLGLIATLLFIVLLINPTVMTYAVRYLGYSGKTSWSAGLTMSQISEFSLIFVILANESNLIDDDLVSAITFVALISIAVSTYMIKYSDSLYDKVHPHLVAFNNRESHEARESATKYDAVIFGYKKGGAEFIKAFNKNHRKYLVVDYDPEIIERLEHDKIDHVFGDVTDSELLDEIGINNVKMVVATFADHQSSLFLTKHLKETNENVIVIMSADNSTQAEELYEAGATYVMLPHLIGSERLGKFIKKHGFSKREFSKFRNQGIAALDGIDD